MLDAELKAQLRAYLERLRNPVELVAALDASPASAEMRTLLDEIAELSPLVAVRFDRRDERVPSFRIAAHDSAAGACFAAVPLGHEFTSLVLALLWAGGHPPKTAPGQIEPIRALDADLRFETWMSFSCHNCPDVVQALNLMALLNPRVRHVAIDGGLFAAEAQARQILAVPMGFLNGAPFGSGRMTLEDILAKVDRSAAARDAARLDAEPPYDMLVVGAGPAGAAAAVYAARKGIRTGVVAERFGGQTLDTLGIENFISVPHTEGPKFAATLEAHVRAYGVPILAGQKVAALEPAPRPGGLAQLKLANGATLRARSVALAPGARWREVGVPGEDEYRTRGVAYCPHCDGPLFKGKRVAVIGGGNSGVEAAIDLAGIALHVTLLEFAGQLKADALLMAKLKSLPNVAVHVNAQTLEIVGDDLEVTALRWRGRLDGAEQTIELGGVFVQIGLQPNTEFLKGAIELNRFGEIIVDDRGATSSPGIYAAGDATTVPFKQIVIAAGDGAKAALSAFDHLIRTSAPG